MKGTIRPRLNKDRSTSWICQVELPRDPATNKRRNRSVVAPNQKEAHKVLHRLISESQTVKIERLETTALTLGELIEKWLELLGSEVA